MEEIKYIHIEDINECCICYEIFNESFKCTRCTFFVVQSVLIIFISIDIFNYFTSVAPTLST